MSRELTLNATLAYDDDVTTPKTAQITDFIASVTTALAFQNTQAIPTSQTAINLGGIAAPRWCMLINRDSVNFIDIKVATGGAIFARLKPGEFCLLPLGGGAQVPFALADTATCDLDVMICSA